MKVIQSADAYGIQLMELARIENSTDAWGQSQTMFVSLSGSHYPLPYITWRDLPQSKPDGSFYGCGNCAWIVSEEEAEEFIRINTERETAANKAKSEEELVFWQGVIARAERQKDIPSPEEARARRRQYNDLYNEGGEGYVPNIVDSKQYAYAKSKIEEIGEKRTS